MRLAASLGEFELLAPLGRGTFGSVRLARHRRSGACVALKALDLQAAAEMKQLKAVERERQVHAALRHPFVCALLASFQDARAVFLVLEFCTGGELFGLVYDQDDDASVGSAGFADSCQSFGGDGNGVMDDLSDGEVLTIPTESESEIDTDVDTEDDAAPDSPGKAEDYEVHCKRHQQRFRKLYPVENASAALANALAKRALHRSPEEVDKVLDEESSPSCGGIAEWSAAFYLACIASALGYLHESGVLYRDLKLENVMLDAAGYVKLIDFGQCKRFDPESTRSATMCGSREYVAPEVLRREAADHRADIWAFGIVVYELLVGATPFYDQNPREMARRILDDDVEFPVGFESTHPLASDLIRWLLQKNPDQRPTSMDQVMRDSAFFRGYFPTAAAWIKLEKKQLPAPFVPVLSSSEPDTRMFRSVSIESERALWESLEDDAASAY